MKPQPTDVTVLYRAEHLLELTGGDQVYVPDLLRLAKQRRVTFSDHDLAIVTRYGSRGQIPCPRRVPRGHRRAARAINATTTRMQLGRDEHDIVAVAAAVIDEICNTSAWSSPLLSAHHEQLSLGAILYSTIEDVVSTSVVRDRIGPPTADPAVAARAATARETANLRLTIAQRRVDTLRRYADHLHVLDRQQARLDRITRVDRLTTGAAITNAGELSDEARTVANTIDTTLTDLNHELSNLTDPMPETVIQK